VVPAVTDDNVIHLNQNNLNDIPTMLRYWADLIERGEEAADSVLLVIPQEADWPIIAGLGEHLGDLGNIATMELAKRWFVNNLTER